MRQDFASAQPGVRQNRKSGACPTRDVRGRRKHAHDIHRGKRSSRTGTARNAFVLEEASAHEEAERGDCEYDEIDVPPTGLVGQQAQDQPDSNDRDHEPVQPSKKRDEANKRR